MKASQYIHSLLILLTLLLSASSQAQETADQDPDPTPRRKWLVTRHAQLTTNGGTWAGTASDVNLIGLCDGDPVKDDVITEEEQNMGGDVLHPWHSVDNGGDDEDGYNYIDIELEKPLELAPGDSLVFYTKRHTLNGKEHPLAFEVMASADGKDFIHYARIYFMYRGGLSAGDPEPDASESATNGTKEYSARVGFEKAIEALKDKGGLKYIRLYVMTNNTKTRVPNTSHRTARLASLNVMQIPAGENYSDILIGRFRLVTDYSYKYAKHEFVPTLGVFEPRNRYQNINGKEYNPQLKDYAVFPGEGDSPWVPATEGEGYVWGQDQEYLKYVGVEMPTYIKQTHSQDPNIATTPNVPGTETENWRQPTNTTEHIVYAMPGDIVPLYPFYGMAELEKSRYNIKFAHWYNYRTGGGSPYLDFLSNPDIVCKSDKYGYYVGPEISYFTKYDPDDVTTSNPSNEVLIASVDEYIKFVESVYDEDKVWSVKLTENLDFSEKTDIKSIGDINKKFKGVFDGQGHTISNLKITDSSSLYVGMFGALDGAAVVKNLVVDETCEFKGNRDQGECNVGLIGYAQSATVSNIICKATLTTDNTNVNVAHNIGGIIAKADNVTIKDCAFTGRVYGNKQWSQWAFMGGLAAKIIGPDENASGISTISNCFVNADIHYDYTVKTSEWNGSQMVEKVEEFTETPSPYIFSLSANTTVNISNVYSNEVGDWEKSHDVLKIYKEDEGEPEYYVLKSELSEPSESWPDKIDINSEDFAEVLGADEWLYNLEKGLVPFVKTIKQQTPVDPDPSVNKDPDEVKGLEDLLKKIYDENEVPAGANLQDHQYKRPAVYAGISPFDDNGNIKSTAYETHHHKAGAAATFFCPRHTDVKGVKLDLPKDPDSPDAADEDFLIAADLSTFFTNHRDVNVAESEIYEPVVLFRHIFRIKDGKTFAEEFSGSPAANKAYVDKHRKIMSASYTGGASGEGYGTYAFQIRLDEPAPIKEEGKFAPPSNLYYKISDTDYRRVRAFEAKIFELDGNGDETETTAINVSFAQSSSNSGSKDALMFYGEGSRMIENTIYRTAGGEGLYSRMVRLTWGNSEDVKGKKFRVRLYAKDINDDKIVIYTGGADDLLVVQEYDITFIEAKFKTLDDALAIEEDEQGVVKFKDDVEAKYGKPVAQINFDQYASLVQDRESLLGVADPKLYFNSKDETDRGDGKVYFKWPASWRKSTYGFGYTNKMHDGNTPSSRGNLEYNYDIYVVASHSSQTPWHNSAQDLYDVSYYRQVKKGNTDPRKGFFFWMNSASDPCVAANLELGQLCVGSSIHVSAYMAEFSGGGENGNLSFNFMAVDQSGNKTLIHTYNTGYLPERIGEWYNIQYDFMPDYERIDMIDNIDHFELQLENNCKNSEQADYAIDDIQLFVVAPEVEAKMMNVVCDDTDVSTDLKISLTYEDFLAANGLKAATDKESAQTVNVYYSFFHKDIFDKFHSNNQEAYDAAVLNYDYDLNGEINKTYGKLQFSTYFQENLPENPVLSDPDASKGENKVDTGVPYYEIRDGRKYVVIFLSPEGEEENNFVPGQEYYIGLNVTELDKDPIAGDLTRFELLDGCSSKGSFKIEAANNVKIDPEESGAYKPTDGAYCVGSSPTVKIDINAITGNDKIDLNKDGQSNASIDWYAGSVEEFNKEKMPDGTELLSEVLARFREAYPDMSKPADVEPNAVFTEAMKNYLVTLSKKRHIDGRPMLTFATVDYKYHPGKLIATTKDSINYVTAIPYLINKAEYGEEKGYTFCDAPIEVRIKVSSDGPSMFHGLDIDYPDEIIDVPIRIGIKQIEKARDNENMLRVPVLKVNTPSLYATKLKLREITEQDGADVQLLESNDPAYSGRVVDETAEDEDMFLTVGHVVHLDAEDTDDNTRNDKNAFYVKFDEPLNIFYDENGNKLEEKKKFEFHEGYYYTMKFDFEQTNDTENLNVNDACPGQHIFTIKVVPEYMVWVGDMVKTAAAAEGEWECNLNWNNDSNWQRLNESTIVPGLEYTEPDEYTDYETQRWAYAPMDFTKVVIGSQKNFPRMYPVEDVNVNGFDNPAHTWSSLKDVVDLSGIGKPTPFIQYDMMAYDTDPSEYEKVAVACRPWYANTAKEINFRPNSEILGQQYLRYEKAWVEMEMKPDGWYTAASPLQGVVAGDMYLPTKGARQENQFFTEIKFDNTLEKNDRFRPAVYQRSWNLASDMIYEWGGTERDGFVALNWSNVYNDVKVAYKAAEGFSIRTDVSEAEKVDNKAIDKVLFRFPKEDTAYTYYNYEGKENGLTQTVTRENPGRLNPTHGTVTIAANESSLFFLVGNPFMAHLDIRKFLEKNSEKVEQTYWILNSTEQTSVVLSEGIAITNKGEHDASTLLPPLAGFMVKSNVKDPIKELTLEYDESMMQVVDAVADAPGWLKAPATRSAAPEGMMLITASTAAGRPTTALLSDGSSLLDANADLVVDPELNVPATVYTVADGRAMSINAAADMHCTELGVVGSADDDITLRFEGPLCDDGYYLNDRRRGCSTPLRQGLEYKVKGQTLGALYISDQPLSDVRAGLSITAVGGEVVVTSGDGSALNVRFCNTAGVVLKEVRDSDEPVRYRPEKGVLIVEAADGADTLTKTLIF
ncbi:MAG: hypothetical protein Q4C37_05575 [Bacteroidales bacterium]|nr:hypothetical protein [Bacteroidales bacterium]